MPSATALRLQIERTLESRFPAALTPVPQTVRETAPVGIAAIDSLLSGGLPVGAISEITGPSTSGRTSLALSFIAQRTSEGKVCAWVDASDSLDPQSAAANGVSLRQLLWVRCTSAAERTKGKPWSRLDQTMHATDLVLQAGGFAAIVLDLGDIPEEFGRRIPLATWYRFRQAADQARSCLVVVGNAVYAQSSAAVALKCLPRPARDASRTLLDGCAFDVQLKRQRATSGMAAMRKQPASTWTAPSAWATGTKGIAEL
jgi:hypothetical protein